MRLNNRVCSFTSSSRITQSLLITLALALALSSLPLAAQDPQIDPFYLNRLEEGKSLYLAADYAGSLESLKVASFGFLDLPEKLLECYIYLLLDYHALKNEERVVFYRQEIRRLKLEDKLPSLDLPPAVRTRYNEINAALARIEARRANKPLEQAPAQKQLPAIAKPAPAAPATPAPPENPNPQSASDLAAQARAEIRLGKKIALYNEALKADPRDITIYFELNDTYVAAKKYRASADLMEILALYYPDELRIYIKLAESYILDKAYEKAYRTLVQAIKKDGNELEIRYLLGRANLGLRRYKEASAEFEIILARDPAYKDAAALNDQCLGKIK
jgi:tetratricopeptide (TPR) repeat protein